MSLYVRPMIKISAAAISSVLTSAGLAWYSYTPPDERAAEVAYYSFGGMFAILFPPAFFLFFIFGAIVSLWLDQRMKGYARWTGVKKAIVMILSYAVIGLIGGLAVSLSNLAVRFHVLRDSKRAAVFGGAEPAAGRSSQDNEQD
ncbi:hypothetical protein ABDI30_00065 [Paenibacillus cisolokensis]|uniref:hypothetical protein n=1 Tax=Paenibacillus cisolokensis TaxID=1658519 RepID=UPI003D294AC7